MFVCVCMNVCCWLLIVPFLHASSKNRKGSERSVMLLGLRRLQGQGVKLTVNLLKNSSPQTLEGP